MARKTAEQKVLERLTTLKSYTVEQLEEHYTGEARWQAAWTDLIGGLIHMAFVEGKGINFVEFQASLTNISPVYYTVTIVKSTGQSPVAQCAMLREKLAKAERRIQELENELHGAFSHD
jgi:hypothetical protein